MIIGDVRDDTTPDDGGITLIELIVYVVVAGIVLAGVAGLFINAWLSQTQTTGRDAATGDAALVGASLAQSIRNAHDFEVEAGGEAVRAIVATGETGWECRAWALTEGGDLMYERSSAPIPLGDTSGWAKLASGATGTLAGGRAFESVESTGMKELHVGITTESAGQKVSTSNAITAQAVIREIAEAEVVPEGGWCGWK